LCCWKGCVSKVAAYLHQLRKSRSSNQLAVTTEPQACTVSQHDNDDAEEDDDLVEFDEDAPQWIHVGNECLPPLVEMPGAPLLLKRVVKPPDADSLWEWYVEQGNHEADSSWACVWPAAVALALHLETHPDLVCNRRVVELGAGLGIVGLTAALKGAWHVVLVDREPLALHCAMSSAAVNGIPAEPFLCASPKSGSISATLSDWAAVSDTVNVDIVLGTEILYDPSEIPALAQSLARILGSAGVCLIADPLKERQPGCRATLMSVVKDLGGATSTSELSLPGTSESVVLLSIEFGTAAQSRSRT